MRNKVVDSDIEKYKNELIPSEFYLSQNYPNPFKDKTTIKYCVAYKTKVTITVFDSEGKTIEKLIDEEKNAGTYAVEFNTQSGLPSGELRNLPAGRQGLQSGIYFYQLKAEKFIDTKKMVLQR